MRYLSLCSGIEAATCAWHSLGWEPVAFSEIDAFPSAVLAHHYPNVPNWGDMTKFKEWPDAAIDLLVGGTPCQSFSIAGLRKGLDDPRGNLMLTYLAIAARYRPKWVVWENVPGVFSSESHNAPDPCPPPHPLELERDGQEVDVEDEYDSEEVHAFQCLLAGFSELGYGYAYRVLDAQYVRVESHPFAVPQRRRRVFFIGYLGDWRRAAAVLFERESLQGYPAPSRKSGQTVTSSLAARTSAGGGLGTDFDLGGGIVRDIVGQAMSAKWAKGTAGPAGDEHHNLIAVPPLTHKPYGDNNGREGMLVPVSDVAPTLPAHSNETGGHRFPGTTVDTADSLLVTHSLRADGFDASEDGTGRGTPLVPVEAPKMFSIMPMNSCKDFKAREVDVAQPLMSEPVRGNQGGDYVLHPVAYRIHGENSNAMNSEGDSAVADVADSARSLDTAGGYATNQGGNVVLQPIAYQCQGGTVGEMGTLRAGKGDVQSGVPFVMVDEPYTLAIRGRGGKNDLEYRKDGTANALMTPNGGRAGIGVGAIAFDTKASGSRGFGVADELAPTLRGMNSAESNENAGGQIAVAFAQNQRNELREMDAAGALSSEPGMGQTTYARVGMQVRRLTPRECERLQGFPDDYTNIMVKGKPAADGPRYKALGNSIAINVIRWVGERIEAVEKITEEKGDAKLV